MEAVFLFVAVILLLVIIVVLFIPSRKKEKGNSPYEFVLTAGKQSLVFRDPFDNFLVYGGANSGKTKSIGKPLLGQYIEAGFAGFIYDYKDFDLTRTAYHFVEKHKAKARFYYLSFTDLDRTYRVNPIAPSVIEDENLFLQVIEDLLLAYQGEGSKRDEWFNGALGILKGIAIRFFKDYPQQCTIPHIVNFACSAGAERILGFVEATHESRMLASAFVDSKGSERTQASYLSSLTNYLSPLAFNKNICYVLSGNDFQFNLIDPECPKILSVANSYQIENVISPVIALMVSISSRRFTMKNEIPFFYFFDEATTFKIPDFEKMPSVLREYRGSFTFMTQSAAKVERRYSRLDRSSIEANFSNQFYGRTKDVEALKTYPLVFGKHETKRVSTSSGTSRGGDNRSRTISTQKEDVYDTNFFTSLQSGEFVGSAAHSNVRTFHLRFDMYKEDEIDLPMVDNVTQVRVQRCYDEIIAFVTGL